MIAGAAFIAYEIARSISSTKSALVGARVVPVTIDATLGGVSFLIWLLFFGVRAENQENTDLISAGSGDLITT